MTLTFPWGEASCFPVRVAKDELLSIGRFAQLVGLTAKALRHYDELGLLRPAHVDDFTGYRWYSLEQARDAVAIRRLRAFELPLDEIAEVLAATTRFCASGSPSSAPGSKGVRS